MIVIAFVPISRASQSVKMGIDKVISSVMFNSITPVPVNLILSNVPRNRTTNAKKGFQCRELTFSSSTLQQLTWHQLQRSAHFRPSTLANLATAYVSVQKSFPNA